MSPKTLAFGKVRRFREDGSADELRLHPGLNALCGPPNTGKTLWLRLLDFILGCPDPIEKKFEGHISYLYPACEAELIINGKIFIVLRDWSRAGQKTKVSVNGTWLTTGNFQEFVLDELRIPRLQFVRGSLLGQPKLVNLSFRTLLRHMYRQQRFWGSIVDQQIESEFGASFLQFIGLATQIYSDEVREGITLRSQMDALAIEKTGYQRSAQRLASSSDPEKVLRSLSDEISRGKELQQHLLRKLNSQTSTTMDNSNPDVTIEHQCISQLVDESQRLGRLQERENALRLLIDSAARAQEKLELLGPQVDSLRQLVAEQDVSSELRSRCLRFANLMNEYLSYINEHRPNSWRHRTVRITPQGRGLFTFRVGSVEWTRGLGGTDSLFFLLSYHYALLATALESYSNSPAFCIVDLPAEFRDEALAGSREILLRPFINLLTEEAMAGAQMIIAGPQLDLGGEVTLIPLTDSYAS